jgi:hypothetical protein
VSLATHRVGDDEDVGLRGVLCGGLGQVADNGGVGVEEICTTSAAVDKLLDGAEYSIPSRVMPGLRGTPAGIRTISAPLRAWPRPEGVGSYPWTFLS